MWTDPMPILYSLTWSKTPPEPTEVILNGNLIPKLDFTQPCSCRNFAKFLVVEGKPVKRFASSAHPYSFEKDIYNYIDEVAHHRNMERLGGQL